MHILVTNDDGPPSLQSSPYIHPFIAALKSAGHKVSVVLPHQQRSWIGKAHFVSQVVQPQWYRPAADPFSGGEGASTSVIRDPDSPEGNYWALIEGTPASCTQLGLFHLFHHEEPIDLVISGPNYGRNVTSLFSLSSGTIGGAMEAATLRYKAIALSFAFWSRDHDREIIDAACRQSVRLIKHLTQTWNDQVDLYSVNVPLTKEVEKRQVFMAPLLQNHWRSGSCFEAVPDEEQTARPARAERDIREPKNAPQEDLVPRKTDRFRWKPHFADVEASIQEAEAGNDGWAISNRHTSVTPLRANFMQAPGINYGELKLESSKQSRKVHYHLDQDEYLLPIVREALQHLIPDIDLCPIAKLSQLPNLEEPLLQILPYEDIDFDHMLRYPKTSLVNAYVIRKALIRKHFLWQTVCSWWSKHPTDTALKGRVPLTVTFELDYAEFLDEALVECWELNESLQKGEDWWILKPSMSDQGQGIRIFKTENQLKEIFEEWEAEHASDDGEDHDDSGAEPDVAQRIGAGTMTSQLRHFIAQRYIEKPLLFAEHQLRKFHIRTYVLAVGALKVYVYRDMLALFAPSPYDSVQGKDVGTHDLGAHLTNTCLQDGIPTPGGVCHFWSLPSSASSNVTVDWKDNVFVQIKDAVSTLFEAAAREQMVHFQTLPNSFEVFGIDWVIDESGNAWLLEVNAFPDFKQSGENLKPVVAGFWQGVVQHAIAPFYGKPLSPEHSKKDQMIEVLDIDLGRN